MSISKLTKYINLALNNSSEGEAQTAARMFFKKLEQLDMRFNTRTFNLTRAQAKTLADLAGKVFKGLNDVEADIESAKAKTKAKAETSRKRDIITFLGKEHKSKREACYYLFSMIDMNNKEDVRRNIDFIVEWTGMDKRSVQSYASNFRAGKWR